MKVLSLVFAMAAAASAVAGVQVPTASVADYEEQFVQWMETFHTHFGDALEYAQRLQTFIANDRFISAHNANGGANFTLGHNAYSHLTFDEFAAMKKGLALPPGYLETRLTSSPGNGSDSGIHRRPVELDAPESIDWVAKGGVTPVKNQGQCGSCWAFSTTGAVEGAAFVASGKLVSLSEQELVDCDHDGDQGCNGGLMDHAFGWIRDHGGICSEAKYEYHAAVEQCHKCDPVVKVSGFKDVDSNDEEALKVAVAHQPVAVAIEADQRAFQFYKSGVFDLECGTQLDHGVLLVGYGADETNGKKFWKVKNSWGATWGESGYIRMSRDMGRPSGQCGIATMPSYPVATVIGNRDAVLDGPELDLQRYEAEIEALEATLLDAEKQETEEPCEEELSVKMEQEPEPCEEMDLVAKEERAEKQGKKSSVYEYFEGGI